MKQEFEMLQEEMDDIIQINKDRMPVLKIGNVTTGMDLQEKINTYWEGLGNKYGFDPMTVEGSGKSKLHFLAEVKTLYKRVTLEIKVQVDLQIEVNQTPEEAQVSFTNRSNLFSSGNSIHKGHIDDYEILSNTIIKI